MVRRNTTILVALSLIALGAYLLLSEVGPGLPGWRVVWPVIPLAGGAALLAGSIFDPESDPDQVFLGAAATLTGLVFFFVTLGPLTYRDLGAWWPLFVLIAGVAFLAQWAAAGFRDWDALFLGLVALCVGGAAAAIMSEPFGSRTQPILTRLWPILLILGGLMALLRGLLKPRSP